MKAQFTMGNGRRKVTVAMLGARMHYAVPRILNDNGLLERFYTDSYVGNKPVLEFLLRALPGKFRSANVQRLLGRKDASIPGKLVTSFDRLGILYALRRREARNDDERDAVYERFNATFNQAVIQRGFGDADTVWGFNSACTEMFRAARDQGLTRVMEQTILPGSLENRLLREVADEWPGWQPGIQVSESRLQAREHEEWEMSDRIVAGSEFVAQGLTECGVARNKISVIPYGVDAGRFSPAPDRGPEDGPLRVLFVGEVGLRKGAPYLLEALRRIGGARVQARFAGRVALDPARLGPYAEVAEFLGPVPRNQMPELFRWAQVFVLPSIVEGSATVTYEALMSGLPLITTCNSGSILRDGESGQIVPARDATALRDAIERYCDDRKLLEQHRHGALAARPEADIKRYAGDLRALFDTAMT